MYRINKLKSDCFGSIDWINTLGYGSNKHSSVGVLANKLSAEFVVQDKDEGKRYLCIMILVIVIMIYWIKIYYSNQLNDQSMSDMMDFDDSVMIMRFRLLKLLFANTLSNRLRRHFAWSVSSVIRECKFEPNENANNLCIKTKNKCKHDG